MRDALDQKRKTPRKKGRGLTNLKVNLVLRLPLEVLEIVRKALQKTADVMRGVMAEFSREEGRYPTKEETIAFLARKVLETDIVGKFTGKSERERAIYDLIYQTCPKCSDGLMHTEDGPLEVSKERVKEVEKEARTVEIRHEEYVRGEALPAGEIDDQDIPHGVKLVVLARDKKACARCGSGVDLHLHHVIFRSEGGPNEVWNLLTVCARDHALIHGGTLEVYRNSKGQLIWNSKADMIDHFLKDELKEFASVPPVTIVLGARELKASLAEATNGTTTALPAMSKMAEGAAAALMKITNHSKAEARERVMKAIQMLSSLGRAPTPDEIFATAFYGEVKATDGKVRGCGNGGPGPESPQNGTSKPPEATEEPETDDPK